MKAEMLCVVRADLLATAAALQDQVELGRDQLTEKQKRNWMKVSKTCEAAFVAIEILEQEQAVLRNQLYMSDRQIDQQKSMIQQLMSLQPL